MPWPAAPRWRTPTCRDHAVRSRRHALAEPPRGSPRRWPRSSGQGECSRQTTKDFVVILNDLARAFTTLLRSDDRAQRRQGDRPAIVNNHINAVPDLEARQLHQRAVKNHTLGIPDLGNGLNHGGKTMFYISRVKFWSRLTRLFHRTARLFVAKSRPGHLRSEERRVGKRG